MKRFLLLWLLVITAILSSCEKRWTTNEPSPSPEPTAQNEKSEKAFEKSSSDEEIKMKSNVINVKKDINQFLIKVDLDKNKIEYKYNTILDQIKEGDVLYSSGVHTLNEAYAIKVKKIVRDGDKLIIETEPAETKDVFTEFQQKGEFVFNQKGETEIFDVEAQLNDISSDTRSINEGGLRSLAIKRIPKNKEKDRGNISYKDGDAVISYPLFDKDGNYKTKEDQILLSLKVKRKKNPFHSMTLPIFR